MFDFCLMAYQHFVGHLVPQLSVLNNSNETIKHISREGNKRLHIFLKSISPKVNVIARLEIELTNSKCCCVTLTIQFNICHLFAHS